MTGYIINYKVKNCYNKITRKSIKYTIFKYTLNVLQKLNLMRKTSKYKVKSY